MNYNFGILYSNIFNSNVFVESIGKKINPTGAMILSYELLENHKYHLVHIIKLQLYIVDT